MRTFNLWGSPRRRYWWTFYVGRAGRGPHRHVLRIDRLDAESNVNRTVLLLRGRDR